MSSEKVEQFDQLSGQVQAALRASLIKFSKSRHNLFRDFWMTQKSEVPIHERNQAMSLCTTQQTAPIHVLDKQLAKALCCFCIEEWTSDANKYLILDAG
jgi:hypothetical protein